MEGGGGGGVPSDGLPKQQSLAVIGFHETLLLSSTYLLLKLLIGFYLVNLKCINLCLKW